jgi:hypothetical protein
MWLQPLLKPRNNLIDESISWPIVGRAESLSKRAVLVAPGLTEGPPVRTGAAGQRVEWLTAAVDVA